MGEMATFAAAYESTQGAGKFAPPGTRYVNAYILTANTPKTANIPEGARFAALNGTSFVFSKWGGAAAVPTQDVTDGNASALDQTQRLIPAGVTQIGLVSPENCIVTIEYWK